MNMQSQALVFQTKGGTDVGIIEMVFEEYTIIFPLEVNFTIGKVKDRYLLHHEVHGGGEAVYRIG